MSEAERCGVRREPTLGEAIALIMREHALQAQAAVPYALVRSAALAGLCIVAFTPGPAAALSLGEIQLRSSLGQRLDASVPVMLAPGETLSRECVTQGQGSTGLARVPQLRIQTPVTSQSGQHFLRLSSSALLNEPMYGIELRIACPGAPVLVRQYVVMLDLPGFAAAAGPAALLAPAAVPATEPRSPAAATRSPTATPRPVPAAPPAGPRSTAAGSPIGQGSTYQVAPGDSLSLIAQRVSERGGTTIWAMAEQIFAANPQAFIGNDPDRIRLGSELRIPVAGTAPAARSPAPALPAVTVLPPTETATPAAATPAVPAAPPAEPLAESRQAPVLLGELALDIPARLPLPAPAIAAAAEVAAGSETASTVVPATGRQRANPLLAIAVGIGLGLLLSLAFGRFSLIGLRRGREPRPGATSVRHATNASNYLPEPGISVEETVVYPAASQAPAAKSTAIAVTAAAASARPVSEDSGSETDITDELGALFGDDDTLAMPGAADSETAATVELPEISEDDELALSGDTQSEVALSTTDLDSMNPDDSMAVATAELSGLDWAPLDEAVAGEAELEAAVTRQLSGSTGIDLQSLAASATHDEKLSESLIEALKLLEEDYQQELTATQLAPMQPAAASGDDPDSDSAEVTAHDATGKRQKMAG